MMKYLRTFEDKSVPKLKDYVLISHNGNLVEYIGQVSNSYIPNHYTFPYLIDFDMNFDPHVYDIGQRVNFNGIVHQIAVKEEEIKYWSKDKKEIERELEMRSNAKNYNL